MNEIAYDLRQRAQDYREPDSIGPVLAAAADEIERLQAETRVLWKCVRSKATERESLEAVKRGDYVTSDELLSEVKARQSNG